jgi:hypothetical protein
VYTVTYNTGVQHTRTGVERVDSGVDTKLSNTTGQHGGGVQVGEGGGGSRISQIISGHVDGLHGGDRTLLGGGNTLLPLERYKYLNSSEICLQACLHLTHISGEGGLVTDGRGNTTEQGRHFGTSLGEAENVVNEEQHILAFLVTEVLGNGQTGKGDTGTGTRGLVHLTEDESDLGVTLEVDDTSFNHLMVEIVTLTSTLTNTL